MTENVNHPAISYLVKKYKSFYKRLGVVPCKVLSDDVHFKNIGWKHTRFDSHGHRRINSNIAMRLNLLPYVYEVVKKAKSYVKEDGALKNGTKIIFYELSEKVTVKGKTKHVTVIISEVPGGKKHYFSARYTRIKKKNP